MDDKTFQETLRKGQEAIDRWNALEQQLKLPGELPRKKSELIIIPALGENLKRLCDECGWTPYGLAKVTGLDKKLVSGHINKGKGCSLGTLKTYAQAFSKELKRNVPIGELDPKRA